MARRIKISVGAVTATAMLNDSATAEAIWNALPFESTANTWGEEIYFNIPVETGGEDGQATVGLGDLGYWPPGSAFCIFFGPTPMSRDSEIRPASPVNVFGHLEGDPKEFLSVPSGSRVKVERVEE
jgi:hypothetical protein